MAYGVGSYALMRPLKVAKGIKSLNSSNSDITTQAILDPYWSLFGEITDFTQELEKVAEDLEKENKTNPNETLLPNEKELRRMTEIQLPIVQAVYMLFGTFLLLNMIIALFSNTISSLDQDSQKIWKFSRVEMIYEYQGKP